MWQIDETHYAGTYYEGMDSILGLFRRTEAPEDLWVIVMGVFNESDIPKDRILDFNQKDNGCRITVKHYVSYSDELDAYAQLNMDILAGNMPDILALDSSVQLQSLISKGLLADVGELISQDAELSDVEFMENVFDALRVDGILYQIVPSFTVDTLIAKRSIVGDRTGWNAEEFSYVLAALPEGIEVVSEMSRQDYITAYMDACADGIIDYESGTCHFASPDFITALEFAATLPETAEIYGEGEYTVYPQGYMFDSRYIEDKVLLQPVSITRIKDLCSRINGALGEDGSYVGFPSDSGEGGVLQIYGGVVICKIFIDGGLSGRAL
ncbi:MAG: extracellular solute-binding protein [Lachnospiraceae bacterium]|nr:extracellular solute-binding protein [Lachnospiraceae bacterium]